jgi:hypothetical protein
VKIIYQLLVLTAPDILVLTSHPLTRDFEIDDGLSWSLEKAKLD